MSIAKVVCHPTDIRELLLWSQCGAVEKLLKTSHASCWPVHPGQVCHLLCHLSFTRYLPGHQGNNEICSRYEILQQKHGLSCFILWCDYALLSGCVFLDWKGSSAGRDQWMCWSLHDTEGVWLIKGNMTAPHFYLRCVPWVHILDPELILYMLCFGFSEQGQDREATVPSWDVLPEAGSLPNALCLGNG